jgi:hypothetical protein
LARLSVGAAAEDVAEHVLLVHPPEHRHVFERLALHKREVFEVVDAVR